MLLSDAKVNGDVINPVSACGLIQNQVPANPLYPPHLRVRSHVLARTVPAGGLRPRAKHLGRGETPSPQDPKSVGHENQKLQWLPKHGT